MTLDPREIGPLRHNRRQHGPILIIEDDPALCDLIADFLTGAGYWVACARNGHEGIVAVARAIPAVILLDLTMPVMNGWSFAQNLRVAGLKVPIVVMTAAYDAKRSAEAIQAKGYLAKPFEVDDLLSTVSTIIQSA